MVRTKVLLYLGKMLASNDWQDSFNISNCLAANLLPVLNQVGPAAQHAIPC